MIRLPFISRKRYIEVKAYTNHLGVYETAPVSQNVISKMKKQDISFTDTGTFYTGCWSRVNTKANSITIQSPCEVKIDCLGSEVCETYAADRQIISMDFTHHTDPSYPDRDFFISKIVMPWVFEDNHNINFVIARHMENTTMMNVLSGLTNFRTQPSSNIFNVIPKIKHRYKIPPLHPMASIYPMSSLPLHLEVYHDPIKYNELNEKHLRLYFNGSSIKKDKGRKCAGGHQ